MGHDKRSYEKLEVFHLRCLRRICGVKWSDVVDNKISNKKVRTSFNNTKKILNR